MAESRKNVSLLLATVDRHCARQVTVSRRVIMYQVATFVLTFITYMLYHANRKVIGVVKQVWNENCTSSYPEESPYHNTSNWCDWPPFDGNNADELLGTMDLCFLSSYAVCMFISGYVAERSNLRLYLSVGMFLAGFFNLFLGLAYWFDMHSFAYFLVFNILAGAFQATGWPAVVALMGNWFGRSKRGFIMGAWNVHTSVGNMFGSFIAGLFVQEAWGLSFAVPAVIMMVFSVAVLLFVAPHPTDVGLPDPNAGGRRSRASASDSERRRLLDVADDDDSGSVSNKPLEDGASVTSRVSAAAAASSVSDYLDNVSNSSHNSNNSHNNSNNSHNNSNNSHISSDRSTTERNARAVSLRTALEIPGVLMFSLALFFIKFVNYVFMFWLPKYIHSASSFDAKTSADMSMLFDAGGMFGGIAAGFLSDRLKTPASICLTSLIISVPLMSIYNNFGLSNAYVSGTLLVITGFFVNAPYALITTAVSAELGQHSSLQGNAKALATVTSVIDGTGSVGAAVGPFLTGLVADHFGWEKVFLMLMGSSVLAIGCLLHLTWKEARRSCSCCRR